MSDRRDELVAAIKDALDEHCAFSARGPAACACGYDVAGGNVPDNFRAHQAQVIASAIAPSVGRDAGLEEAAKWLEFNDGHADRYAHIAKYIRALKSKPSAAPSVGEWVSVDERLPEAGWVLTCEKITSGTGVRSRWFRADGKFVEVHTIAEGGDIDCSYFVTHWMPLPAPPSPERKDEPHE